MAEAKEKFTIAVFSGELDKALAAFFLATTAATMGMQVTMFFTFWGLNIIKKNEGKLKSKNWMHRMLNLMNRGGSKRLKISKFHMLGMGEWMIGKLMKETKTPTIEEFIVMAHQLGVRFIACTTSCGLMGVDAEDFRPEVETMAGAAYYIGEAREAKINLFI